MEQNYNSTKFEAVKNKGYSRFSTISIEIFFLVQQEKKNYILNTKTLIC